jgi:hypothetical protein
MYGVGKDGSFKYAKQEIKTCQLQKIHNLAKKPGTHNPGFFFLLPVKLQF